MSIKLTGKEAAELYVARKEIEAALHGKRRSKYNVDQSAAGKEARTLDGVTFASRHEMEVYRDYVKPNVMIGLFRDLKFQVRFDLHAVTPGGSKVKVGTYIADWTCQDRQGQLVVIEAKGKPTPLWKRSQRHVEAEYGVRVMVL